MAIEIRVRVSREEKEEAHSQASEYGLSLSDYLRVLLKFKRPVAPTVTWNTASILGQTYHKLKLINGRLKKQQLSADEIAHLEQLILETQALTKDVQRQILQFAEPQQDDREAHHGN
ncbi:plasmid mobilization protein [Leptolyngbya sp. AN02str]|uniref:plasmid mobilization protein n=1 Tax=Leptolyngbya sp. AN02str TaxID=3423363 RepID=UPI003D31206B